MEHHHHGHHGHKDPDPHAGHDHSKHEPGSIEPGTKPVKESHTHEGEHSMHDNMQGIIPRIS